MRLVVLLFAEGDRVVVVVRGVQKGVLYDNRRLESPASECGCGVVVLKADGGGEAPQHLPCRDRQHWE
jgi:hypothetical protein